jgi:hypothetical protein
MNKAMNVENAIAILHKMGPPRGLFMPELIEHIVNNFRDEKSVASSYEKNYCLILHARSLDSRSRAPDWRSPVVWTHSRRIQLMQSLMGISR